MQQQGSHQGWFPEAVKERLRDSSWVTLAWDWFQTLLGRAVEAVLWATMVFSCYQLIPGAAQPAPAVSSFAFILQFIALDIGGLGLNKVAQQQGLARWSYPRVIAYILIGITLVTVAYAGIEHAVQIEAQITAWVEVTLVVARSIMTVLYGQAIHSLKQQAHSSQERIAELEQQVSSVQQQVSTLRHQLNTEQQQVSTLRVQLDNKQRAVDTLTGQIKSGQAEVSRWEQQARSGQSDVSTLHKRLQAAQAEAEGARVQLSVKQREVDALRTALDAEQQQVSRLRVHLQAEQERLFTLSQRLDTGQAQQATKKGSSRPVSSVQSKVDTGQVDTGQVISLDASRARRKSEQDEGGESVILEQVRELLKQQPGLSARAIAKQLACSPTTAAKWKEVVEREQEQQHDESSTECVNE